MDGLDLKARQPIDDELSGFPNALLELFPYSLRVYIVAISPEMAAEWLLVRNTRNRNMKQNLVRDLAEAIVAAGWVVTGETVTFDTEGVLSDGQNRLAAIVKAGLPAVTLVVTGVDPAAGLHNGALVAKRTLPDQLTMLGESDCNNLAAALSVAWMLTTHGEVHVSGKTSPRIGQAVAWLDANPGLRDSLPFGRKANRAVGLPNGAATALHYLFRQVDQADADRFFELLFSGADLSATDPILVLRETLTASKKSVKVNPGWSRRHKAALTIKAWNAWRRGDEIKALRWRSGGAAQETFPSWTEPVE